MCEKRDGKRVKNDHNKFNSLFIKIKKNTANITKTSENVKDLKDAKFLNLGKIASYLGADASSDQKMDVEFVISNFENPPGWQFPREKIFRGCKALVQVCLQI